MIVVVVVGIMAGAVLMGSAWAWVEVYKACADAMRKVEDIATRCDAFALRMEALEGNVRALTDGAHDQAMDLDAVADRLGVERLARHRARATR